MKRSEEVPQEERQRAPKANTSKRTVREQSQTSICNSSFRGSNLYFFISKLQLAQLAWREV